MQTELFVMIFSFDVYSFPMPNHDVSSMQPEAIYRHFFTFDIFSVQIQKSITLTTFVVDASFIILFANFLDLI